MKYLAILLLTLSVWGGQSIVIDGTGSPMTFSDPNLANTLDWRVEFQIHGFTAPASVSYAISLNGVGVDVQAQTNGNLWLIPKRDSVAGGSPFIFSMTGRANTVFRLQRDYAGLIYTCEAWEADGSKYEFQSREITSVNSWGFNGGQINEANLSHRMGFLRLASARVAINSRPPVTADAGDMLELKFDGNGNDSSGNGRNLSSVAGVSFVATPGQIAISLPATPSTPAWAKFIPLRAGHPSALASNSYSMADASSDVTCLWQQIEGPSQAVFDSRSSCSPTLTGLIFGPYVFRLAVTDSAGQTGVSDFDVGAVAYDDNGVVIYPDERLNSLLGPSMVLGANPWVWADRQSIKMATKNWDNYKLNGGTWDAEWLLPSVNGVARQGTVYKPSGTGSKLYGVGTNFLNVFCNGSVGTAAYNVYVVVDLPPADPGDEPSRYARQVGSCESDTELTFSSGWGWERPFIASPGTTWGTIGFCADCSLWNGRNYSSDVNYYDNALAEYALYYRTGWKKARDSARWMADRFAYSPWIGGGIGWAPRHAALTSAVLRSVFDTGGPATKNVWPILRGLIDGNCASATESSSLLGDVRESGYCLGFTALKAKYDPDSTERTESLDRLVNGYTNRWGPQQTAAGAYREGGSVEGDMSRVHQVANGSATVTRYSGSAYPSDYCGTVYTEAGTLTVNNTDRVSVTGTGTSFTGSAGKIIYLTGTLDSAPWSMISVISGSPTPTSTTMTLQYPWRGDPSSITKFKIMDTPPINPGANMWPVMMGTVTAGNVLTGERDGDNWYYCTYVDGDTLTLDKPYTGDTSGGNVYRRMSMADLAGNGTQPFMMGIVAWAQYLAADALDGYNSTAAANYRTIGGKSVDWIWNYGRNPSTKGLRYGVDFSNCTVTSFPSAYGCWRDDSDYERAYNIETVGAFARKYLESRSASDLAMGNALYTDTYAKNGFASPFAGDGHWNVATDEGSYDYSFVLQTKNYGQAWGIGGGQTWPAARLGGPAPAENRTLTVQVGSPLAYGDRIRITATNASGVAVTNTCQAVACSVTSDFRAGGQTVLIEYLNASSAVLARATQNVIVN